MDDGCLDEDIAAAASVAMDIDEASQVPTGTTRPTQGRPSEPSHPRSSDLGGSVPEKQEYVTSFPREYKAGAGWTPPQHVLLMFVAVCNGTESNPYAPFDNKQEWELGQWLIKNVGQAQTEAFLKLPIVCMIILYLERI
jgi:hypothetical protein